MQPVDLTKVIEIIILVVVAPFIPILALQAKRWLDSQISLAEQRQILDAVRTAVLAAEQLGYSGAEAKAWAIESAELSLAQIGVVVDVRHLADLIEAQVYQQFNQEWK